jgi:hypothetical protein
MKEKITSSNLLSTHSKVLFPTSFKFQLPKQIIDRIDYELIKSSKPKNYIYYNDANGHEYKMLLTEDGNLSYNNSESLNTQHELSLKKFKELK